MHYIVPCGDIPSKTTNFSVDRYAVPYTSCYCIGHAPTSYRMLLYRACCCQIVFAVWYKCIQFHSCPVFPSIAQLLRYCGKRQKHITLEKVISRRCTESWKATLIRVSWFWRHVENLGDVIIYPVLVVAWTVQVSTVTTFLGDNNRELRQQRYSSFIY